MSGDGNRQDDIKKLWGLIKDIKFGMLTTQEPDGTLRSRPMANQKEEFDGTLWFFTGASSAKVDEVQREHHVNVSYADPDNDRYVSVSGMAQLVRDRQKMEDLWNPVLKAWFPQGLDDPDLALLKVDARQAEYWDSPNGAVVHLLGLAKAVATGQPAQSGENEKISLA